MKELIQEIALKKQRSIKSLAVLIDPDKIENLASLIDLITKCNSQKVDYFLVGGSLITDDSFSKIISILKDNSNIPVIIFPGNHLQIDSQADALFLLSLISGRNPEFLIGQHVMAAPIIKKSKLEVIPVGYILVNSGAPTSVSYISNTTPIPADKPTIAACTAMAGEMLGLQAIYLEAGSGAISPVPQKVISKVAQAVDIPIIVGGGLNSIKRVNHAFEAGADIIVVGNALEKNPSFLNEVANKVQMLNETLNVH